MNPGNRNMVEQMCPKCESNLYHSQKFGPYEFGSYLCKECNEIVPLNERPRYIGKRLKHSNIKRRYPGELTQDVIRVLYDIGRPIKPTEIVKILSRSASYRKVVHLRYLHFHLRKLVDNGLVKHKLLRRINVSLYSLLPVGYELAQELTHFALAPENLQARMNERVPTISRQPYPELRIDQELMLASKQK